MMFETQEGNLTVPNSLVLTLLMVLTSFMPFSAPKLDLPSRFSGPMGDAEGPSNILSLLLVKKPPIRYDAHDVQDVQDAQDVQDGSTDVSALSEPKEH